MNVIPPGFRLTYNGKLYYITSLKTRILKNMKKLITIYAFLALLIVSPGTVFADLKVHLSKESALPFSLSPQNPVNSPGNANNSIDNPGNSVTNRDNSSSNPENSPSKTENGMSGNRRLLFEKDGSYYFIGYFVLNENRLINFFSPFGKRMFYTPSGSDALFGSESGEFSGALSTVNGKTVLMITENGQTALKKAGISPFSPSDTNIQKSITGMYHNTGNEHRIETNYSGSTIILEDGSIWDIDPLDKMISALWKYDAIITVSSNSGARYEYRLSNSEDGKVVRANYIGKR
jgi:hypothetical protein